MEKDKLLKMRGDSLKGNYGKVISLCVHLLYHYIFVCDIIYHEERRRSKRQTSMNISTLNRRLGEEGHLSNCQTIGPRVISSPVLQKASTKQKILSLSEFAHI